MPAALATICGYVALVCALPSTSGAHSGQDPKSEVRVAARFVDAAGAPLAGVTAQVFARPATTPAATGVSGADGRVALACPVAEVIALHASLASRASARWFWIGLAAGEALDLGDVELPLAAAARVHIVDRAGELLGRDWRVFARDYSASRGPGRGELSVEAPVDPATGFAELAGLTPGKVRVGARGPGVARIDDVEVVVQPGATAELQLVYMGGDPARVIIVQVEPHLVDFVGYGPSPVTLVDAAGQRHALQRAEGRNQWSIAGIADGEYAVEIDERPFAPWRAEGVRPGQTVRAALRGDATVQLEVIGLDGVTAHADYAVFARHLRDSGGYLGRALTASAPGTFSELPAGTIDLEVRVEGLPMRRVRVDELAPGETRLVRTQLTKLGALRGVVRDADGAPVAGRRIEVTRGEVHGHSEPGVNMSATRMVGGVRRVVPIPRVEHVLSTDARGEFALEGVAPDLYALRVQVTPVTLIDRVVEVAPGDGPLVELALPPFFDARLRVLVPEGVDASTLAVRLARAEGLGGGPGLLFGQAGTVALDNEGRCTVRRLIEGEYALELVPFRGGDPERRAARPLGPGTKLDLGGFALGRYLWLEPGEDPATIEHVFDVRARSLRELAPPK